jgi:hypothetical protein
MKPQPTHTPIDMVISCSATGNLTSGGLLRYIESEHVDKDAKVELGEYIVRAVNNHDALVMALKTIVKDIENNSLGNAVSVARFAIAAAEGKE